MEQVELHTIPYREISMGPAEDSPHSLGLVSAIRRGSESERILENVNNGLRVQAAVMGAIRVCGVKYKIREEVTSNQDIYTIILASGEAYGNKDGVNDGAKLRVLSPEDKE
jgi:hypothetical protein